MDNLYLEGDKYKIKREVMSVKNDISRKVPVSTKATVKYQEGLKMA